MTVFRWRSTVIVGLFLAFCYVALPVNHAQDKDSKKKAVNKKDKKDVKKDDKKAEAKRSAERMRLYMKQLHARFDAWDANNDNTLDARELAKVFRGPKADPLDKLKIKLPPPAIAPVPVPVVTTIPGKVRPISIALLTLPYPSQPASTILASLLAQPPREVTTLLPPTLPKVTPPKVIDYTRFADYQFLMVAGKGKDWNISKSEFESFAKQYAKLLDELEESEHDVAQAKARLAKAANAKAKNQAAGDLQKANAVHARFQSQWNAFPQAIHQALKIKH